MGAFRYNHQANEGCWDAGFVVLADLGQFLSQNDLCSCLFVISSLDVSID